MTLIKGRNFLVNGAVQPVDPTQPGEVLTFQVNFATAPTNAVANIAPMKYNKIGTIQLSWDDGSAGPRLVMNTFKSMFYTDGCGNNIPYTGGLALTSGTGIAGDFGYNADYWQQPELRSFIINNNWDIINHTDSHGGNNGDANRHDDIYNLQQRLVLRVGYLTGYVTIPDNYTGYTHEALIESYSGVNSTGDVTADELQSVRVYEKYPTTLDNPYITLFNVRDFNDQWDDAPSVAFCKTLIDDLGTGVRNYVDVGTHSGFDTTALLNGYIDFLNYINTHNQDRYAVIPMRERLDFRRMSVQPVTQSLNGNVLSISVDTTGLSDKTRWYDMSFNIVSDGVIQSITAGDFTSASFNHTTGLVNAFKQKTVWS